MNGTRKAFTTALATAGAITAVTVGAPASPAAAQVDPCVQRVVVSNNSGGILSYVLSNRLGVTNTATDQYPVNQWRTTDLTTTAFTEGEDVRPIVSVQAGDTVPANNFVSFCANGQTATYTVTGTINDISITLIGA
jgi:hypothetical protein